MAHKHRADGSLTPSDIERDAAVYGLTKTFESASGVTKWGVECQRCEKRYSFGWFMATAPEIMVKRMRNSGWLFNPKLRICTACRRKEKIVSSSPAALQIGPDPKIARKIYAALDDHFDEAKKLYRPGWSDAKIAAEIDTSPEIVARIRKDGYGDLAEDPVIQALRDDVELLRMEVAEIYAKRDVELNGILTKIADLDARISHAPGIKKAVC